MTDKPYELRCGRWQDVLADVECDALITDPPYSERVHSGHDRGVGAANRTAAAYASGGGPHRRTIAYPHWTAEDVRAFVDHWAPRVSGWILAMTDHVLAPSWEAALLDAGRYVFAPLACVEPGSRVRLSGDGPAQWAVWLIAARPASRAYQRWGALPGAYVVPHTDKRVNRSNAGDRQPAIGGKPLWLMQALVRDYSRPGDLICDPCAGGATTLLAAAIEGRRAIGAEMDPATFAKAQKRLARGYTPNMFATSDQPEPAQIPLIGVGK